MNAFTEYDFETDCPYCGHHCTNASNTMRSTRKPKDGDASMCIACGKIGIFKHDARGGVRKPTRREDQQLNADPGVAELRRAWQQMDEMRRRLN